MKMLQNFYSKFPLLDHKDSPLNPYPDSRFNDVIVSKKEFAELALNKYESFPDKPGDLLNHQKYVSRFLSMTTGFNELLLFHEPGTGKTCSAVATIEALRASSLSAFKGAVICAKGEGLLKNFVNEFAFTCTDGRYIPNDYENLTKLQKTVRLNKIAGEFYSFRTFETFAKELAELSDEQILSRYQDDIFVVDEVHNLRQHDSNQDDDDPDAPEDTQPESKSAVDIYSQFERLFRVVTRRKILLMSGTPIKDIPEEFASVMNLILPKNLKFPTGKEFVKTYFNNDGSMKDSAKNDMIEKIRGRISYLNSATSAVEKRFIGTTFGQLKHFIVFVDYMSPFQSEAYSRAYAKDERERSIFISSRQASLFVFPDGSVGKAGFDKFITRKVKTNLLGKKLKTVTYEASQEFIRATDSIEKIERLSSKFASVLKIISDAEKSKHFVYCQYVNGSGAIVFGKLLERMGWTQATGSETTKAKRYALITRQTASSSAIQKLISAFNFDKNVDGEYISVVIGSRVLNEGFTLKNVRNEFILTTHWNYAETVQAIARGWRVGSHNEMLKRGDTSVQVSVFQCVSIPRGSTPSIDLEMYQVAEGKDVINRQIERLVKENAFDCPLAIERNKVIGYDGQRECDYTSCDYECAGKINMPLDRSTFDLMTSDFADEIQQWLNLVFKSTRTIALEMVSRTFPEVDTFQMAAILKNLIENNHIFLDQLGFSNFLRLENNLLFLSTDPPSNEFSRFYSSNLILTNGISFENLLEKKLSNFLPTMIDQIFNHPELTKDLLIRLSKPIQREILQACLIARDKGLIKNSTVRDQILEFYFGFYDKRIINNVKTWVVSLYAESLGFTCFDETTGAFSECDGKALSQKRVGLKDVAHIGYFGLWNPTLDDFCLRSVDASEKEEIDLRKLSVGRRCINFESETLIDIIARRMMVDPPDDFLENESLARLKKRIATVKFAKPEDSTDAETMKRFLYWTTRTKDQICKEMKKWFETRNLLETSFNCGSQRKKRVKLQ